MFEIKWDKKAKEELEKLNNFIGKRIVKKIREISEDPFPHVKKLKASSYFRLRVGDYRIILDIDHAIKILKVVKLGHRKNIYER